MGIHFLPSKKAEADPTSSLCIEEQMEQLQVPPFLFIPFVENVVKHGAHQAMEGGQHVQIGFSLRK
ncbi:hypothetical protein [Sphingobacterium athyrii]|uniref:Uncharacterized protein n=1 Tax=Sphingobacterium athyrii TaxID=2152717 RepID=A0A363NW33_9SPHI|nr:hypothetical protein [Sphingobacterium athyrii]PUV24940.1 hypothetical protein DCO56_08275 [Sphingobacterium athyrii]